MDKMIVDLKPRYYTNSSNYKVNIETNHSINLLYNASFHGKDRSPLIDVSMTATELDPNAYKTLSGSVIDLVSISEYNTQISQVFSINLKKPITISVTEKSDHCLFDCTDLDIYEAGDDFHDAMMNFCQFFSTDLEYWQSTDDGDLTKDALILKEKYLSYV
jgi:hypothetical protein